MVPRIYSLFLQQPSSVVVGFPLPAAEEKEEEEAPFDILVGGGRMGRCR